MKNQAHVWGWTTYKKQVSSINCIANIGYFSNIGSEPLSGSISNIGHSTVSDMGIREFYVSNGIIGYDILGIVG